MKKKLCAMLLCAVLLLSSGGLTAKAAAETPPKMTIEVNQVTGGTTVEVSLIIENATETQSAHAVLSYDTTKLTLTQWDDTTIVPAEIPAAGGTMAPGNVAGKPSLVLKEGADNWANLYFGAAGQQAHIEAGKQVVTVQFQYGKSGTAEELKNALASYLKLAEQVPSAFAMMPDVATLHAGETRYTTSSIDAKLDTTFSVVSNPSLYNKAGTATAGDYAITFFDWDGKVVDVAAVDKDATVQATAAQKLLSSKQGYAFDQWLLVNQTDAGLSTQNGTFTSNDSALDTSNADIADLENVTQNLLVQAAYVAKTTENGAADDFVNGGLSTNAAKYYTIAEPEYTRYGAADSGTGQYSLKMQVTRENRTEAGSTYGVTRLRRPAVVVAMLPSEAGAQSIVSLVELENTDNTTFEVVPTKAIASVRCWVIDLDGVSNWPGAPSKSAESQELNKTFVLQGSLGYLAAQAYAVANGGEWESYVDANLFKDAGFSGIDMEKAKTALVEATKSNDNKLTTEQVQTALRGVSA